MNCTVTNVTQKGKFISQSPWQLSQKMDFGHRLIAKNNLLNHPPTATMPTLNPGHPAVWTDESPVSTHTLMIHNTSLNTSKHNHLSPLILPGQRWCHDNSLSHSAPLYLNGRPRPS